MHGKYQKLVEAAREAANYAGIVAEDDFNDILCEIEQALDELEPYKWLAMDEEGTWIYSHKPEWICEFNLWGCPSISNVNNTDTTPSFLRPGQLWERTSNKLPIKDGNKSRHGEWSWNGYWWRLVEDHSKRCENCAHYEQKPPPVYSRVCWLTESFDPYYSKDGCKWQAR